MGVKLSGAYADTKSGPPLYADSSRETSSEDPAIALRSGYSTTTPHLLPGSRIGPCHFPQHAQCPARIIAEERVPIPREEYEAPDVPYVAARRRASAATTNRQGCVGDIFHKIASTTIRSRTLTPMNISKYLMISAIVSIFRPS